MYEINPKQPALPGFDWRSAERAPCPFCGNAMMLVVEEDHHGLFYSLGCSSKSCIAYLLIMDAPDDELPLESALRRWNSRRG